MLTPLSSASSFIAPTRHPAAHSQAQARQLLAVQIGEESYGIDILRVQEIRHLETPTRMAGSPPHLLGVIDLRGVIVPLADLRIALGLPQRPNAVLIVLMLGERQIGVVVDAVSDVLRLRPDQIRPAPALSGTAIDGRWITGLGVLEEGATRQLLILLDIDALLHAPSMGLFSAIDQH